LYSLRIPADLNRLEQARRFVEGAATALGLEGDVVHDLMLAADEAATNVIVHGYAGVDGEVELAVSRRGADLELCVRDDAPQFDPTGAPSPDVTVPLEARRPGGLGIYLIRRVMDEVCYRRLPGGGNELVMTKRAIFDG
jgi:serine/threonine-protein kinase RsbW